MQKPIETPARGQGQGAHREEMTEEIGGEQQQQKEQKE